MRNDNKMLNLVITKVSNFGDKRETKIDSLKNTDFIDHKEYFNKIICVDFGYESNIKTMQEDKNKILEIIENSDYMLNIKDVFEFSSIIKLQEKQQIIQEVIKMSASTEVIYGKLKQDIRKNCLIM